MPIRFTKRDDESRNENKQKNAGSLKSRMLESEGKHRLEKEVRRRVGRERNREDRWTQSAEPSAKDNCAEEGDKWESFGSQDRDHGGPN